MHGRGRCTRRASRRREPGQPVRTQEVPGEKREPATASGTCWGPPAERSEPGLHRPRPCIKIPRSSTPSGTKKWAL